MVVDGFSFVGAMVDIFLGLCYTRKKFLKLILYTRVRGFSSPFACLAYFINVVQP